MYDDEDPIEIPGIAQRRRRLLALALVVVAGTGGVAVYHARRSGHGSLHSPEALDPKSEFSRALHVREVPLPNTAASKTSDTATTTAAPAAAPVASPVVTPVTPTTTIASALSPSGTSSAKVIPTTKPVLHSAPVPSAMARTSTPRSADPARPPAVGGIVRDSPF